MEWLPEGTKKAQEFHNQLTDAQWQKLLNSEENPNIHAVAEMLISCSSSDVIEPLIDKLVPQFDRTKSFEDLIKQLASIEDVMVKVEEANLVMVREMAETFKHLPTAIFSKDTELARQFSECESLSKWFETHTHYPTYQQLFTDISANELAVIQSYIACQLAGLNKSANTILEILCEEHFGALNFSYIYLRDHLKSKLGIKATAKTSAERANDIRHDPNRQVKNKALELYKAKKDTFKSVRQASRLIEPEVEKFALEIGSTLEWKINGTTRIANWIYDAYKDNSV